MDKQNFTERNRRDIVAIATQHFAEKGYAGARVDEIAAATATSKRMIYYHFGSKDGLYRAVLTEAYRGIRSAELEAELGDLPPLAALERLTALTFDYHFNHPELVRLVMDENIRGGPHVGEISEGHNEIVLPKTQALIDRGIADGSFRAGLDAVDLQEEGGAALNLRSDPKRNAKDVLGHRKTYVVVRVGEPPRPPREPTDGEAGEEGDEAAEPEAGPDPDALVPLTFELPADPVEPVEEPAAEPAAEEGAE